MSLKPRKILSAKDYLPEPIETSTKINNRKAVELITPMLEAANTVYSAFQFGQKLREETEALKNPNLSLKNVNPLEFGANDVIDEVNTGRAINIIKKQQEEQNKQKRVLDFMNSTNPGKVKVVDDTMPESRDLRTMLNQKLSNLQIPYGGLTNPISKEEIKTASDVNWDLYDKLAGLNRTGELGSGSPLFDIPRWISSTVVKALTPGTYNERKEKIEGKNLSIGEKKEKQDLLKYFENVENGKESANILQQTFGKGAMGYLTTITSAIKGIDTFAQNLANIATNGLYKPDYENTAVQQGLNKVDEMLQQWLAPTDKRYNISGDIAQGIGSSLGFLSLGKILPVFKDPMKRIMLAGALTNGQSAFEETYRKTKDVNKSLQSFYINAAMGTTEALPLADMLDRIAFIKSVAGGKKIVELFKNAGKQFIEEGAQELGQSLLQDIESMNYDNTKTLGNTIDNALYQGLVGGLSGALMTGMGSIPGLVKIKTTKKTDNLNEKLKTAIVEKTNTEEPVQQKEPETKKIDVNTDGNKTQQQQKPIINTENNAESKSLNEIDEKDVNSKTKTAKTLDELPVYPSNIAYRYESGYTHTGKTKASDVVKFEREELGNDNNVSKDVEKILKSYKGNDLIWVTSKSQDAERYISEGDTEGKVNEVDIPPNSKIIGGDEEGGYLILMGDVIKKDAKKKPEKNVKIKGNKPSKTEPIKITEEPVKNESVKDLTGILDTKITPKNKKPLSPEQIKRQEKAADTIKQTQDLINNMKKQNPEEAFTEKSVKILQKKIDNLLKRYPDLKAKESKYNIQSSTEGFYIEGPDGYPVANKYSKTIMFDSKDAAQKHLDTKILNKQEEKKIEKDLTSLIKNDVVNKPVISSSSKFKKKDEEIPEKFYIMNLPAWDNYIAENSKKYGTKADFIASEEFKKVKPIYEQLVADNIEQENNIRRRKDLTDEEKESIIKDAERFEDLNIAKYRDIEKNLPKYKIFKGKGPFKTGKYYGQILEGEHKGLVSRNGAEKASGVEHQLARTIYEQKRDASLKKVEDKVKNQDYQEYLTREKNKKDNHEIATKKLSALQNKYFPDDGAGRNQMAQDFKQFREDNKGKLSSWWDKSLEEKQKDLIKFEENYKKSSESKQPKQQQEKKKREERKNRILAEGTGFDESFGLKSVKDINSENDILSNIGKILQTLKANEGNGKYKTFEGFAYEGKFAKNAGEQIKQYMLALDVLPEKLQKRFYEKNGIKTYEDIIKWGEKQYKNISSEEVLKDYPELAKDAKTEKEKTSIYKNEESLNKLRKIFEGKNLKQLEDDINNGFYKDASELKIAKEVLEKRKKESESDEKIYNIPISDIKTDVKRFQNRKKEYVERHVQKIIDNYDERKIRPVTVWQDPKDGNYYVLSGHNRLEVQKRLGKNEIKVTKYQGTEEEAIKFARTSNSRRLNETKVERADYYREERDSGTDEKDILEEVKANEDKNWQEVYNYSFLKFDGDVERAIEMTEGRDKQMQSMIETIGSWIGELRRIYPELTDSNEQEMFEYLKSNYGKPGAKNKTEFKNRVEVVVNRIDYKQGEYLNLKNKITYTASENEYIEQLKQAEKELNDAKKVRDEKQKDFIEKGLQGEDLDRVMKKYNDDVIVLQREYIKAKGREDVMREARKEEVGLFDSSGSVSENLNEETKTETNKEYGAAMVEVPAGELRHSIDEFIKNNIKNSDVYKEEGKKGKETDPHITVLYGIETENPIDVKDIVSGTGEIKVMLGKTSIFENDKYDVLKVDVMSDNLHALNKKLRDNIEYTNEYDKYSPHLTLAYLKKGTGKKYAGNTVFEGKTFKTDKILFSDRNDNVDEIFVEKSTEHKRGTEKDFDNFIDKNIGNIKLNLPSDNFKSDLEKEGFEYLKNNLGKLIKEYYKRNHHTLDVDKVRELFVDAGYDFYNANDFHEPASALGKVIYDLLLDFNKNNRENPIILFLIGSPGAGKTYSLNSILKDVAGEYDVIYDGVLSKFSSLKDKIEKAKERNYVSELIYVYSPAEKAWQNVLTRLQTEKRPVPYRMHLSTYSDFKDTIPKVFMEYDGYLNYMVLDNSGTEPVEKKIGLDIVEKLNYTPNEQIYKELIQKYYDNGKINEKQLEGLFEGEPEQAEKVRKQKKNGEGDELTDTKHKERAKSRNYGELNVPPLKINQSTDLSDEILQILENNGKIADNPALIKLADKAFNGTIAQGKYSVQDAYNALETAVNMYIVKHQNLYNDVNNPLKTLRNLRELTDKLPTQRGRTKEKDDLQQFSTPPTIGFIMNYALSAGANDTLLEPSAGNGGLIAFSKGNVKEIIANEIDHSRAAMLMYQGYETFTYDAKFINDLLPKEIKPTSEILNPPFSATGGKSKNDTSNGLKHIEQALTRLENNGRAVILFGEGLAFDKVKRSEWWNKIMDKYNVLANLTLEGEFVKYGTTFGNQLIVIDKTGPTKGENLSEKIKNVKYGKVTLEDAIKILKPIRNERITIQNNLGESNLGLDGTGRKDKIENEGTKTGLESKGAGSKPIKGKTQPGKSNKTDNGEKSGSTNKESNVNTEGKSDRESGRMDKRPDNEYAVIEGIENEEAKTRKSEAGGKFVQYTPSKLKTGSKHPGIIVESSSMASVEPPNITYTPKLPKEYTEPGESGNSKLSSLQIESVVYAGQRHSQILPNGYRAGFFIGDGTGVGKGKEIGGIIADNINQGRKKILWLSVSQQLESSALKEVNDLKIDIPLFNVNKYKNEEMIEENEGIIFATYSTLIAKGGKRLDQLIKWLGNDCVIVMDECHKGKNFINQMGEPTQTSAAMIKLQEELKGARVVYSSATGATEVRNMAYMVRLGLWGEGTNFPSFDSFMTNIEDGGLGAMEMVSRDMKALGMYASRRISYEGVQYEEVKHTFTKEQRNIYDTSAELWQVILQNIDEAIDITESGKRGRAKAMQAFWGSHQRFYNQLITAFKIPTVIKETERHLKEGKSVVLSLINTNEIATAGKVASAVAEGKDLADIDFTPRELLYNYLNNAFPIYQYEKIKDKETGQEISVQVKDEKGNPVISQEALQMRDELLDSLGDINIPDNPLDQIINYFGVDNVAELSGRKRQLLRDKVTGEVKYVPRAIEGVASNRINNHEKTLFQNGEKRLAVITAAASTGISLHSSKKEKNKQKRVMITVQMSWSADQTMQTFGRVHRSFQDSPPIYVLLSSDASGEVRFTSTMAKRLATLGALSTGQRDTGGGDNLSKYDISNQYGKSALKSLYDLMMEGVTFPGISKPKETLERMGILKNDSKDGKKIKEEDQTDVEKFLNRILALKLNEQKAVFDAFENLMKGVIEKAKDSGTFDEGISDIKGESVRIKSKNEVNEEPISGAKTYHYQIEADVKTEKISFIEAQMKAGVGKEDGYYKNPAANKVYLITEISGVTDPSTGKNIRRFARFQPNGRKDIITEDKFYKDTESKSFDTKEKMIEYIAKNLISKEDEYLIDYWKDGGNARQFTDKNDNNWEIKSGNKIERPLKGDEKKPYKFEKISKENSKQEWNKIYKNLPDITTRNYHIIGGAILPIWNKIQVHNQISFKVDRVVTDKGERIVGIEIPEGYLKTVLANLGVVYEGQKIETKDLYADVMKNGTEYKLLKGLKLKRTKYHGEQSVELANVPKVLIDYARKLGLIEERIDFKPRFFIPNETETAINLIQKIVKDYPVQQGEDVVEEIEKKKKVLEYLTESQDYNVTELSETAGIDKSEANKILSDLYKADKLKKGESGTYIPSDDYRALLSDMIQNPHKYGTTLDKLYSNPVLEVIKGFGDALVFVDDIWQKFVGDKLWNSIIKGTDITSKKILGEKLQENIKELIVTNYGLPDVYLSKKREVMVMADYYKELAKDIANKLVYNEEGKKYSEAEQIRLGQIIKGGITSNPELRKKADEVRSILKELHEKGKKLEVLPIETYNEKLPRKRIHDLLTWKAKYQAKLNKLIHESGNSIAADAEINLLKNKIVNIDNKVKTSYKLGGTGYFKRVYSSKEGTKNMEALMKKFGYIAEDGATGDLITRDDVLLQIPEVMDNDLRRKQETINEINRKKEELNDKLSKLSKSRAKDVQESIDKTLNKLNDLDEKLKQVENSIKNRLPVQEMSYKKARKLVLRGPGKSNVNLINFFNAISNHPVFTSTEQQKGFVLMPNDPRFGALAGKYVERSIAEDIKGDFKQNIDRLTPKKSKLPTRLDLTSAIKRQDIPLSVRMELGEILTASYPTAKAIMLEGMDISLGNLFKHISEHPEYVSEEERMDFVKMPDNDMRLGMLQGKYVDPRVAGDIEDILQFTEEHFVDNFIKKLTAVWKGTKTVMNPATHFRNIMSASIFVNYSGISHTEQATLSLPSLNTLLGKGPYAADFKASGLKGTTFNAAELERFLGIMKEIDFKSGLKEGWENFLGLSIADKMIKVYGKASLVDTKFGEMLRNLYQNEDMFWKAMIFIHKRQKGFSIMQARDEANKWMFDYSEVPKIIEKVRSGSFLLGMPFISWSWKALPRVAEAAITRPLTFWKYPLLFSLLSSAALKYLDLDDDEWKNIKATFPDRLKKGQWILMPLRDDNGSLQLLDLTYIVPYKDWYDVIQSGVTIATTGQLNSGDDIIEGITGFANNPIFTAMTELSANKNRFLNKPIWNETDKPKEKLQKALDYMYKLWMPSLMPGIPTLTRGGYSYDKLINSLFNRPDYQGRVFSLAPVIGSTIFGLKTNPVEIEKYKDQHISKLKGEILELNRVKSQVLKDDSIDKEERLKRASEFDTRIKTVEDSIKMYEKSLNIMPETFEGKILDRTIRRLQLKEDEAIGQTKENIKSKINELKIDLDKIKQEKYGSKEDLAKLKKKIIENYDFTKEVKNIKTGISKQINRLNEDEAENEIKYLIELTKNQSVPGTVRKDATDFLKLDFKYYMQDKIYSINDDFKDKKITKEQAEKRKEIAKKLYNKYKTIK